MGEKRARRPSGVRRAEGTAILAALRKARGNREEAAALLDVSESTLYRKLRDLRRTDALPEDAG